MNAAADSARTDTRPASHERGDRLLWFGLGGTVITAICCFTPLLVILLGTTGLAAALVWLDFVLLPALVIFLGITGYALWRRRGPG